HPEMYIMDAFDLVSPMNETGIFNCTNLPPEAAIEDCCDDIEDIYIKEQCYLRLSESEIDEVNEDDFITIGEILQRVRTRRQKFYEQTLDEQNDTDVWDLFSLFILISGIVGGFLHLFILRLLKANRNLDETFSAFFKFQTCSNMILGWVWQPLWSLLYTMQFQIQPSTLVILCRLDTAALLLHYFFLFIMGLGMSVLRFLYVHRPLLIHYTPRRILLAASISPCFLIMIIFAVLCYKMALRDFTLFFTCVGLNYEVIYRAWEISELPLFLPIILCMVIYIGILINRLTSKRPVKCLRTAHMPIIACVIQVLLQGVGLIPVIISYFSVLNTEAEILAQPIVGLLAVQFFSPAVVIFSTPLVQKKISHTINNMLYNIKYSYCCNRQTSHSGYSRRRIIPCSKDVTLSQSMSEDEKTNKDNARKYNKTVILRNDLELLEVCSSDIYQQHTRRISLPRNTSLGRFTIFTIPKDEEEKILKRFERDNLIDFDESSLSSGSTYYLTQIGGIYKKKEKGEIDEEEFGNDIKFLDEDSE
ncbi:unnamed protein product, partial [Meganyctiphanes norvegica]